MVAYGRVQPSESLRQAFGPRVEAWLGDLQGIVDAEVARCHDQLQRDVQVRVQELEAEWSKLLVERERLQCERDALGAAQAALDREKSLMQGRLPADVVDLNIGGQVHCSVKRATLCQVDQSALGSMFSGRWEGSVDRDSAGRVFIDSEPELFMPLVNFLRQRSIQDPGEPAEAPEMPPQRLAAFKRMLSYYGMLETVWPRPEGKWELAWGHLTIDDEQRTITVSAQGDSYQAAAINTIRVQCSPRLTHKLRISKLRNDAPWFYDSVAFGAISVAGNFQDPCLQEASKSDLLLNLKGDIGDESANASIDLGGLPADQPSIDAEITIKPPNLMVSFNEREHMSAPLPPGIRETSCCLLLAVTYPWIQVHLLA